MDHGPCLVVLKAGRPLANGELPLLVGHRQHPPKRNVLVDLDRRLDGVEHSGVRLADHELRAHNDRFAEELGQPLVEPDRQIASKAAVGELMEALMLGDVINAPPRLPARPERQTAAGRMREEDTTRSGGIDAEARTQRPDVVIAVLEDQHVEIHRRAGGQRRQTLGVLHVHQVDVTGELVGLVGREVGLDPVVAHLRLGGAIPPRQLGLRTLSGRGGPQSRAHGECRQRGTAQPHRHRCPLRRDSLRVRAATGR